MRMLAALAVASLITGGVVSPGSAQELPRVEIERLVREYLLREPEVIYEALQVLQTRRESAEAERQQVALRQHGDEIYRRDADPVIGNPRGDVTLVEFFDYRCGYCRSVVPALRKLLDEDDGVRLVVKELPILGPQSVTAAQAALAAERQGKYREMHFALLEAQDLSQEAILQIARAQGLDPDRLAADMASREVQATLDANLRLAEQLGIGGTPAFAIGGTLIPGAIDHERLVALIAEERQAAAN